MKKSIKQLLWIGLGLAAALVSIKASAQANKEEITGKWYAEELEQSIIEIKKAKDGTFEGLITESAKEDYVGQKVIYGFEYDEKEKVYDGTIYSVARRFELDGQILLEGDDRLKITGKKFFMTRTFYWVKSNK